MGCIKIYLFKIPRCGVSIIYLLLMLILPFNVFAQQNPDKVEFKVTTSSPGGNFSPKNIGAIWIEDASGNFIKTIKLWANRRKQYLYTWNNASGGNTVDAVTTATLSSHQTHEVSWNITDVNGNTVPQGNYKLFIEMTDEHAQGPIASFVFPIGEPANSLTPPDETYFHNIELSWNSTPTYIQNEEQHPFTYRLSQNYPNPFNPVTDIKYFLPKNSKIEISVYDTFGKKLSTLVNQYQSTGNYSVIFNASDLASGTYYYQLVTEEFIQTNRMLLIK